MRIGQFVRTCGMIAVATASGITAAQSPADPKPAQTAAGTTPSTFRSYIVVDQRTDPKSPQNRAGKLHDLINENSLNPVIGVFCNSMPQGGDDEISKLVKKLKEIQATYKADEYGSFVIFAVLDSDFVVDPKADTRVEELKAWAGTVPPGGVAIGLAKKADGKEGDALKWNLSAENVTVVFYNRHKLIKRWDVPTTGITDQMIAEVSAEADKEMKRK
jgi:hypothetical protein